MPTINKPFEHFNVVTYTGNGSTQSITGVGFQPDVVWIKSRSVSSPHHIVDSVRGANRDLFPNLTDAEFYYSSGGSVTSFNADGFSLGNQSSEINANGTTYVAWCWKANGAGSTNTAGSITSTVSANTSAGFSVVTFTNTAGRTNFTVGHGLGVAPKMVIMKTRSATADWVVYHESMGATKAMYLNQTSAAITSSNFFNNTAPTSSVVTFGSGTSDAGVTIVAYCFAEVAGYSKFGSYTGNGSADGPFVFTGFRPRYVMFKSTSNLREWFIVDTSRSPSNVVNTYLRANTSAAEGTDTMNDLVSNGFKLRSSDTAFNGNGETYIYMAFAENPFKYSLAR